jgi:hypothetical protein
MIERLNMTQDEIIELARQAGAWETDTGELIKEDLNLQAFAKLVAEREREACAKVCDDETRCEECGHIILHANLIRARGQAIAEAEKQEPVVLAEYDAGSLNDYGGGNVEWWWDYIRYELGKAHDHYQEQVDELYTHPQPQRQRQQSAQVQP